MSSTEQSACSGGIEAGRSTSAATVELHRSDNYGQSGRVFLPTEMIQLAKERGIQEMFDRDFADEDDEERLSLLKDAVSAPTITIATYPGYDSPQELHAYVEAPGNPPNRIFACVLMSLAAVKHNLERPPRMVMETASLQVVGPSLSDTSIAAAVETWIARMFPGRPMPRILLNPWPGTVESEEES